MSADSSTEKTSKGLKGVIAADSSISKVNGEIGRLVYRGYNIDDLAEHGSFEETSYLLFKGDLPTASELDSFKTTLAENAGMSEPLSRFLHSLPTSMLPMSALRSAVSVAGNYDADTENNEPEALFQRAIRLTAVMATLTAAIHRLRKGEEPLEPKPELGLAGSFMYMLSGREPTEDEARAMDLILILHAEHGLNASTFAARVICATLTDLYSAITGAVGALKGKLHGGANTAVIQTLEEIGSVDAIENWVNQKHAEKHKFMGFGHAVYKASDPRAKWLKEFSERLGREQGEPKWYEMSARMEELVVPLIGRECNVDFYSASLQHYLGVPDDLFTCVFASSRIVGWCAHVIEQIANNKIIRPSANYVGPEEREYTPLGQRG